MWLMMPNAMITLNKFPLRREFVQLKRLAPEKNSPTGGSFLAHCTYTPGCTVNSLGCYIQAVSSTRTQRYHAKRGASFTSLLLVARRAVLVNRRSTVQQHSGREVSSDLAV